MSVYVVCLLRVRVYCFYGSNYVQRAAAGYLVEFV